MGTIFLVYMYVYFSVFTRATKNNLGGATDLAFHTGEISLPTNAVDSSIANREGRTGERRQTE